MTLSGDELLKIVASERQASIGFDDDVLTRDRVRALEYYKGEMNDVASLPNRSRAVSTDIADAVETVLPDIIEIFTGGDDVAAFMPHGKEDEEAAAQETDYVNHVVFDENDGFMNFYTMFKDALLEKIGVLMAWWEDGELETERFEGRSAVELAIFSHSGAISEVKETQGAANAETLYDFTFTRRISPGRVRIAPIAPADLSVAKDTVRIPDATYCAYRSHVRAQSLIADGIAREKVDGLRDYSGAEDDSLSRARDTAGEGDAGYEAGGHDDLRIVEIVTHFLRVDRDGDGKPELLRIVTDAEDTTLLDVAPVNRIDIFAVTPFPVTHRFHGQSLADRLVEIQRIKTVLVRALLDSAYFALNQRMEVAQDRANAFTIPDLLRNEPGFPVRSKSGDAVRPINAGGLGFDAYSALEYFSVASESRTGIVRNAQGLNPDTLHETAQGAMALMQAAQKRVRLMARIFAETGIKDLFLGVHALVRENATKSAIVRLRGKWVEIDPTVWGVRKDMTIEVGLGASGREHDGAVMAQVVSVMKDIVALQGGAQGPLVKLNNVYAALKSLFAKWGLKAPELFVSDPAAENALAPGLDPALLEAQERMAFERETAAMEHQLKREEMQMNMELKREQFAAELQMKRERIALEAEARRAETEAGLRRAGAPLADVQLGGKPG